MFALQSNCPLCENPYPYMCSECNAHEEAEVALEVQEFFPPQIQSKKIFVGSGEDVCLETVFG